MTYQTYPAMASDFATKVARWIVAREVSVPTWIVIYINVLISMLVVDSVYLKSTVVFDHLAPFEGRMWPFLLLASSLVTLHGLLTGCPRTTSWGALFGFMSWVMALLSWFAISGATGSLAIPLLSLPMAVFFTFVHLKHSYLQKLEEESENG